MADRIPDAQPLRLLTVQKNRKKIVGNYVFHDRGEVCEQFIEIQRFRSGARHLQKEVEQLGALAEADGGLAGHGHGIRQTAIASTIFTLLLEPIRVAPAVTIFRRSASVRMPPEAFTPMTGPTARRISATSSTVAPAGPKPVEVLTNSAPASLARPHAVIFCSSVSKAVSRITFTIAPP